MKNNNKNTPTTKSCKNNIMVSVEFQNFKDNFLAPFIFTQIERSNFNEFLLVHFKVYNIIYKNSCTVKEYAKIALCEEFNEFEKFGMQLKIKQKIMKKESYSEQDVLNLLWRLYTTPNYMADFDTKADLIEWFTQFKKLKPLD